MTNSPQGIPPTVQKHVLKITQQMNLCICSQGVSVCHKPGTESCTCKTQTTTGAISRNTSTPSPTQDSQTNKSDPYTSQKDQHYNQSNTMKYQFININRLNTTILWKMFILLCVQNNSNHKNGRMKVGSEKFWPPPLKANKK